MRVGDHVGTAVGVLVRVGWAVVVGAGDCVGVKVRVGRAVVGVAVGTWLGAMD